MAIAYRNAEFVQINAFDTVAPWSAAGAAAPTELLSSRECEIAQLVATGLSNKAIGRRLGISHFTVSTHLRRIFAKLDINNRIELCRLMVMRIDIDAADRPHAKST